MSGRRDQDDDEKDLYSPKTLGSAQILDAINHSSDGGATIFLARLEITEILPREAEELSAAGQHQEGGIVERLTLGNNRLSTLPTEFELFTRLRYLNLKRNNFSTFPDVLTCIPLLDILDISHNKVERLPAHPGSLVRLRVLCLSRNKITRLPSYLSQFRRLDVLQIDRNPIHWPPRSAIESFGDAHDMNHNKEFVRNLQSWLEGDIRAGEYDDSGYSEQPDWDREQPYDSWLFPVREADFDAGLTPHTRSLSADSNLSISDLLDESSPRTDPSEHRRTDHLNMEDPLEYNRIGNLLRPSEITDDFDTFYTPSPPLSKMQYETQPEPGMMHNRTSSYTNTLQKPQPTSMNGKKSLPDLRIASRDHNISASLEGYLQPSISGNGDAVGEPSILPSTSLRQDSESSSGSVQRPILDDSHVSYPRPSLVVVVERSSYFRRSVATGTNESLPKCLSLFLETARTILFALGQLYQALDQYILHGGHERLFVRFKKVLEPANVNILHLIRSLDRFDDASRKTLPSPAICRGLVESCRDTITSFRKAVVVWMSQIGLEAADDARFLRWLILELYATNAELSIAWQAMVPQVDSLRPFLHGGVFPQSSQLSGTHVALTDSTSQSRDLAPAVRLRPTETLGPLGSGRARTARRHAGSFSSKDVQIGKELPSYDIIPSMAGGLATDTPTLRTPKRLATVPIVTTTASSNSSNPHNPYSYFPPTQHVRYNSQSSLHDDSFVMSPSTSPESHVTHFSAEILAVQDALDTASIVWDQIEDALSHVASNDQDIRESLETARSATRRLARNVADLSEGDFEVDKRLFKENVHAFLKTIVQLSNILKSHSNLRLVPAALRSNMAKLTNSTQDFAVLLQASSISFAPRSSSPTSYPKLAPYNVSHQPIQDNQLSSSLARSRSTQPSTNSAQQSLLSLQDGSRSIAPLHMKSPSVRRLHITYDTSLDSSDPG